MKDVEGVGYCRVQRLYSFILLIRIYRIYRIYRNNKKTAVTKKLILFDLSSVYRSSIEGNRLRA